MRESYLYQDAPSGCAGGGVRAPRGGILTGEINFATIRSKGTCLQGAPLIPGRAAEMRLSTKRMVSPL